MAKAIITGIDQAYVENGIPKIQVGVVFGGADVPGTFQTKGMIVDVTGVTNVGDLGVAIAAATRATATQNGYTVLANNVFLPSYIGV